LAAGPLAVEAVTFYLIVYFIMTIGAFGVVIELSVPGRDADSLEEYRGLFWRRPWLAASLTIMLLSLAGIPLTGGFLGKFYVIAAGADASLWLLVILLVVNSVIGLFYYLRVIVVMAAEPQPVQATMQAQSQGGTAWMGTLSLAALTLLLIAIGVYPEPIIGIIHMMVTAIG